MKNTTIYAEAISTNTENAVRRIQPAPGLLMYRALPTTAQEMTRYVEQLLTMDEQAVSDMATD